MHSSAGLIIPATQEAEAEESQVCRQPGQQHCELQYQNKLPFWLTFECSGAPVMTGQKKPVVIFLAIHFSRTLRICKLTGRCCQQTGERLFLHGGAGRNPYLVKETG